MAVRPDVVFGRGTSRDLCLDIFTPDQPNKNLHIGVIQLHPGGFRVGNRKMIQARSETLSQLGFTCFAAEYRLVPEATWPAQIHDVKAAIRWVRIHAAEWNIDPDRILLQGFSAGAHLALFAAGTEDNPEFEGDGGEPGVSTKVAAVVALYPPTDMFRDPDEAAFGNQYPVADMDAWNHHLRGYAGVPSWVLLGLGASDEAIRRSSPSSFISSAFPPTLLMHGTADILVPFASTVRFHQALITAGVTSDLHLFGGQPHGFDAAQSYLRLTQEESALFYRRTVIEPDLIPREFTEAMAAMMAGLPANMRPPGMPPFGVPPGTLPSSQ
jgi:acetyl esterase/lipase